ncbi:hypothetical protein [Azospirillum sp. TSO35-2]|uniref:hypothetical protein n=1 Tax=Azospirillum sp. TSO35-2 TaxID=716796 RepID=UPI001FFF567F|nr:hypothetical protein [Azospirillum sp. TSO35-2]
MTNADAPNAGAYGGGPITPGRAGQGMGVATGTADDTPGTLGGGPETTVTVGADTGQRRDLPDQHAAPPTPKSDAGKRPRNREAGKPG